MHAVGRIAYNGWIGQHPGELGEDRIGRSQATAPSGCNDLGGTLMDENILPRGGRDPRQQMHESDFGDFAASSGAPRAAHDLYGAS